MYDIIVVGGGPAGMTAALYAQRNGKSALVIEKNGFGGQMTNSPKIENYPGTEQISGNELADQMMGQIMAQGADIEIAEVTGITADGERKVVTTDDGEAYECKAVIIANGVKHRMLGLPGEEDLIGDGISFCAVCDGDFYTDKVVCVAGGGNSALQEAILLSDKCAKVIMLQDLPFFTGEQKLQDILFARDNVLTHVNKDITAMSSDKNGLRGIEITDRTSGVRQFIACDGLFEAIGLIPENEAFANVAELNEYGYFATGEKCNTKTPGVFVAGDCRKKDIRQIATACGDGAVAALAACRYINGL